MTFFNSNCPPLRIKKVTSSLIFSLLALANLAPFQSQALPSGLVGWWQAESNVVDSVGNHNGFINLGVNYVPGSSGQAFDVEGGIVTIPDSANLRPLTNVTLQAWVKSKAPNTFKYIIAKAHNTANASYAIYTGSTGGAAFFVSLLQPTNNSDVLLISPAVPPATIWDNNWHQLTGVFDGTTSHLYVDGTEVGAGTANTNSSLTNISYVNPQPLIIGSYRVAGDLPFVGAVDEAKIFNVAMTASDVASTFNNSSSPAATNGLISWYRAEGNAQDSWGSNHGTVTITGSRSIDYTAQGRSGTGFFSHGSEAIVPDALDLQPNNLTLQLWVKSVSPGTFKYPVSKWRGTNGGSFANSYAIYTGSGGGAYFFVNLVNGATDTTVLSPQAPAASVWDGAYHLLTGTWDGAVSRIYIDGFEQGSGTTNTISTATTIDYSLSRQLLFGDYETPAGLPLFGFEDEIQLYNRALSSSEVLSNFTGFGNLVSWWNANSNANDQVGANNGSLTGNASYVTSRNKAGSAFGTTAGAVVVPDSPSLHLTNLTLQAEVAASFPGANRYIISKSCNSSRSSYAFDTGPSGGLQFYVNLGGTTVSSPDAGTAIWDGNFHLIDGSYDGSAVHLFVDGREVGSGTSTGGQIQYDTLNSSGELLFGDFVDTLNTNSNFAGTIDEVKIYSSALNLAQIAGNAFHSLFITSQPRNTSALAGQNATFSVAAQAPPPLTYQWLFNGSILPGSTSSSLNLTNVQSSQQGNYSVLVTTGGAVYTNNTITNAYTSDTITGKALQFGQGSLVEISNTPAFETQDFTVQLYARATKPGTYKWMLSKSRDPSHYSASYGLYTGASGGAIWFVVLQPPPFSTNSFSLISIDAGTNVWDGKWHQFTGVWGSAEFLSLYVDGALVNTIDTFGGTVDYEQYYLNGDLMLGDVQSPAGSFHFPGDMDEVKVFNHSLTADDVMASYTNHTSFGATNGLVNWYRFENNTADAIGGNDGRVIPTAGSEFSDLATLTVTTIPASLVNVGASGGTFSATVAGPSGLAYIVQRSTDLVNWVPLSTNTVPFTFSDTIAPGPSSSFYRAIKGN